MLGTYALDLAGFNLVQLLNNWSGGLHPVDSRGWLV